MKLLRTGLPEIETAAELEKVIAENENVMVCCGRMGPMCFPVYNIMERLDKKHSNVKFMVMAFDNPEAAPIRNAPECSSFMGLPFTMYYKKGKVTQATTSIQTLEQVLEILNEKFGDN